MNYSIIPAALIITLIITFLFALYSKRPFRNLALFFIILFLATWSGQLWIMPFGPVTMGIAWVSLFIVPLFFAFLIFAFIPGVPAGTDETQETPFKMYGFFALVMLALLIISIVFGYYRIYYFNNPDHIIR